MKRFILLVTVLGAVWAGEAWGQDRLRIDLISGLYDYWSDIYDIALVNDRAYIAANNRGLIVADFNDPDRPEVLGSFHTNNQNLIMLTVVNDIAYTLTELDFVWILDVSNPEEIRELAMFPLQPFWKTSGIVYQDGLLFIGSLSPNEVFEGSLFVYDVEDPERPTLLSRFTPPDENVARLSGRGISSFDVEGEFVYISNQHYDMFAVRISDPENPEIVATISNREGFGYPKIRVINSRIYTGLSVLRVFDFDEEQEFSEVVEYDMPGDRIIANRVISGNELYYTKQGRDSLYSLDISDIQNVQELGSIQVGGGSSMELLGNTLLMGDYHDLHGLFCIDITDPGNMRLASEINHHGYVSKVKRHDDLILVSGRYIGIRSLDVSDPENPQEIGLYNRPNNNYIEDFIVIGQRIYIVASYSLRCVNIEDPTRPVEVFAVDELCADAIASSDNFLFTVGNMPGISVYNLADPDAPELVNHLDIRANFRSLAVSENRLFLPTFNAIRVFDISNPEERMEELEPIDTEVGGPSSRLVVSENYLCVCEPASIGDGNLIRGYLTLIDIEDLDEPRVLSTVIPRNLGAYDVEISGNSALVAAVRGGISLYDISNPEMPLEVGWYDTYGTATGVDFKGNTAYVADHLNFSIYDLSEARNLINEPPTRFDLISPSDGDSIEIAEWRFVWEKSIDQNQADTVSYLLFLGTNFSFQAVAVADTSVTVNPDTLWLLYPEYYEPVEWWVMAISNDDTTECNAHFTFTPVPNAVRDEDAVPQQFILYPPVPNPFNSTAVTSYELRVPGVISLELYDAQGRLVRMLAEGWRSAGEHRVSLSAEGLAAGEYLIRLTNSDDVHVSRQVTLVK